MKDRLTSSLPALTAVLLLAFVSSTMAENASHPQLGMGVMVGVVVLAVFLPILDIVGKLS
ncbi:MAG: hypothetical protein COA78_14840 [Blastopirellula sp.]|nr:MAG: hypothetical protein COA78_14840 [Blastopirellula sp.]